MITSDEFTFFQVIYVQIMDKCWFDQRLSWSLIRSVQSRDLLQIVEVASKRGRTKPITMHGNEHFDWFSYSSSTWDSDNLVFTGS